MEPEVKEFMDSILAENTRKNYTRALQVFEEYTGRTISEVIKERREDFNSPDMTLRRRLDRKVEQFYVWLVNEKKVSENTAYIYVTGLKSIMSFYDVNLKVKVSRKPTMPKDWVGTPDELRRVYETGDLLEKTLIALASNVPLRINDFNEVKKKDILPLLDSSEYPVNFTLQTKKYKVPMPCFITKETADLLKKYVKTLREDNEFLFQGRGNKKLNEDSINRILKNLVKKADIDTKGKRVRFHTFRKVFSGIARSMVGLSDDQIKMLTGKRIKADMEPYYVNVELKPLFEKVSEKLSLNEHPLQNHVAIENLQRTIATQQTELQDMKTRIEALTNQYSKLQENMEKTIREIYDKIEETIAEREMEKAFKELQRPFTPKAEEEQREEMIKESMRNPTQERKELLEEELKKRKEKKS